MNNGKNIKAIIQARTGSTRLQNKIFKELCGRPILWHVWNRLQQTKKVDDIIIATTVLPEDDSIQKFCDENSIPFYRGSSDDVLGRYFNAAQKHNADIIIRITADCPVIDPTVVEHMIEYFLKEDVDYVSNSTQRTFPRGLDAEIFSYPALEKAHREAKLEFEREHVTPYIYNHPELFSLKSFLNTDNLSHHRWTVDTEEDFILIKTIYEELYNQKKMFLLDDILKLLNEKPELIKINQHIEQKKLGE